MHKVGLTKNYLPHGGERKGNICTDSETYRHMLIKK